MKRCRIGAVFLIVLLLCAVAVSWAMTVIHAPVSRDLSLAAQCGDAEKAAAYAAAAQEQWTRWRLLRDCLADHSPTEEIDALFAALEAYQSGPDLTDFSVCVAQLAQMVDAVAQAHSFSLGTFF